MDNVTPAEALPLSPLSHSSHSVPTSSSSQHSTYSPSTSVGSSPTSSSSQPSSSPTERHTSPRRSTSRHVRSSPRSSPRSSDRSESDAPTPVWRPADLAPAVSSSPPSSPPPPHHTVTLDLLAFPHIFNAIVDAAPHPALLALRPTCRAVCARIDAQLARHVLLEQVQVTYPPQASRARTTPRQTLLAVDGDGDSDMGGHSSGDDSSSSDASIESDTRPHLALLISDPKGRRIPGLPSGTYQTITRRQSMGFSLIKVLTLRGVATPHAFTSVIPYVSAVHTVLYRVRGYAGPLPRSRLVVPIPSPPPQAAGPSRQIGRWSLGPAVSDTLVVLAPLSHMGAGFVLHMNAHREVIIILTATEVTLSALGFFASAAPGPSSEGPAITSATSPSPTPSPFPSAPSSPIPWARPPAAIALPPGQPASPLSALRHIIRNVARTIGHTRFTVVGLELLDPNWLTLPLVTISLEDVKRHIVHSVIQQAWKGDWYGPGDEMERAVSEKIDFITHGQYESRVGTEQYQLETRL